MINTSDLLKQNKAIAILTILLSIPSFTLHLMETKHIRNVPSVITKTPNHSDM